MKGVAHCSCGKLRVETYGEPVVVIRAENLIVTFVRVAELACEVFDFIAVAVGAFVDP
jgi:hypothetical protein